MLQFNIFSMLNKTKVMISQLYETQSLMRRKGSPFGTLDDAVLSTTPSGTH